MAIFQAHVSIPYFSAIPADVCTNVWSFNFVGTAGPTDFSNLASDLILFYEQVYGGGASSVTMANYAVPGLTTIKIYALADPTPRAPVYETQTPISGFTPAATMLPPESSVCLSFQGVKISGDPQNRRRGRIFLGCLATAWDNSSTSAFPKLNSTKRTYLCTAMSDFQATALADNWIWGVYSRIDNALVAVDNGWVDDAPDTQRRRGNEPTARTTWSV